MSTIVSDKRGLVDPLATSLVPLYTPQPEGCLIKHLNEDEARALLKTRRATLVRDKHGLIRRLYLQPHPDDQHLSSHDYNGGTILSQANRTIRKQHLNDTYWTYQHITNDLEEKRLVQREERVADGLGHPYQGEHLDGLK